MQLRFLTGDACPSCGCTTVVQEEVKTDQFGVVRTHVNGGQWESRTFACGQRLNYIPNFSNIGPDTSYVCQQSEAYKTTQQLRKAAVASLLMYLKGLNVPEDFRERLEWVISHA